MVMLSRGMKRFRSVDLDTPYVDGGQLHVSSTKVKFWNEKIPAHTQCSHLRTNFHLKGSANKNPGLLFLYLAPQALGQWSEKHILGLYIIFYGTARIKQRHCERNFRLFRVVYFRALYAPMRPKQELVLTSVFQIFAPWCLKACWFWICQYIDLILYNSGDRRGVKYHLIWG